MITYRDSIIIGSLTSCISRPVEERPYEGSMSLFVNSLSPRDFFSVDQAQLSRLASFLEKVLRGSKTLDLESLLISPASSCWNLRIDVHIIQSSAETLCASSVALIALLLVTKIPQACLDETGNFYLVPYSEKNPLSLNLFFRPLASEVFRNHPSVGTSLFVAFSSTNEVVGISQECFLGSIESKDLDRVLVDKQRDLQKLDEKISQFVKSKM